MAMTAAAIDDCRNLKDGLAIEMLLRVSDIGSEWKIPNI